MIDIFISFTRQDRAQVQKLAAQLEKEGLAVEWDPVLESSDALRDHMERALSEAKSVLVVWSEASIRNPWVRTEAEDSYDRGVYVPVIFDQVADQIPPLLRKIAPIDLRDWDGETNSPNWRALVATIKQHVNTHLVEPNRNARDQEADAEWSVPDGQISAPPSRPAFSLSEALAPIRSFWSEHASAKVKIALMAAPALIGLVTALSFASLGAKEHAPQAEEKPLRLASAEEKPSIIIIPEVQQLAEPVQRVVEEKQPPVIEVMVESKPTAQKVAAQNNLPSDEFAQETAQEETHTSPAIFPTETPPPPQKVTKQLNEAEDEPNSHLRPGPYRVADTSMTKVSKGALNVREGPSPRFDTVTVAERGTSLRITGKSEVGHWYRFPYKGGKTGYIYGPLVKMEGQTHRANRDATVRAGPDAGHDELGTVASGAILTSAEKIGGVTWYRVELEDGTSGFVYGPSLGVE